MLLDRIKKMNLRFAFLCVCLPFITLAQPNQNLRIGIDVFKSIIFPLNSGYHFDPVLNFRFSKHVGLSAESIWVNFRDKIPELNIAPYQVKGSAQGLGFYGFFPLIGDKNHPLFLSFKLKGFYSQFQEKGTFEVPGSYFGNYRENFEREKLCTFGAGLESAFFVQLIPRFWLYIGFSYAHTFQDRWLKETYAQGLNLMGIRYVPGVGRIIFPSNQNTIGGFAIHSKLYFDLIIGKRINKKENP